MRTLAIAFAVVVATSCGHPRGGTSTPPEGAGDVGAVCNCSDERPGGADDACVEVACKAGLVCGYGCGIPGCDSTCMTPEQFEASKTIP